jgi:hypothetical protein
MGRLLKQGWGGKSMARREIDWRGYLTLKELYLGIEPAISNNPKSSPRHFAQVD